MIESCSLVWVISLLACSFPDESRNAGCWASLHVSRMFRGCRVVASNPSFLLLPLSLSLSLAERRVAGSVPQEMLVQFLKVLSVNTSTVPIVNTSGVADVNILKWTYVNTLNVPIVNTSTVTNVNTLNVPIVSTSTVTNVNTLNVPIVNTSTVTSVNTRDYARTKARTICYFPVS